MWVKFIYKTTRRGLTGSEIPTNQKFAIETESDVVSSYLDNHPKVYNVKVMTEKPQEQYTILLDSNACVQSNTAFMVSNDDLSGFIWSLKAGIALAKR